MIIAVVSMYVLAFAVIVKASEGYTRLFQPPGHTKRRSKDEMGATPMAATDDPPDPPADEGESYTKQVRKAYSSLTDTVVGHIRKVKKRSRKVPAELVPLFEAIKGMDLKMREQFANLLLTDVRVRKMKFGDATCTMGNILDISPSAGTPPITLGANGQDQAVVGLDSNRLVRIDGARAMTGVLNMGSQKISSLATPTLDGDAATKGYTDGLVEGLAVKDAVRVSTTGAQTLAGDFENGDTIDGVVLATGNRVLIKDQAAGTENGIYVVKASGAPDRADDLATGSGAAAAYCWTEEGTVNADTGWHCTNDGGADVVGTHVLTWTQFSGSATITAGDGLTKTGNDIDADNGAPALTLGTVNTQGTADTALLRVDAAVALFDVTVPDTIQPDDAAATGAAAFAARRDHTHGIVCAAAEDVDLAASDEGAADTFARSDHHHALSQAITPTWTGIHVFDPGATGTAIQIGSAAGDDLDVIPHTSAKSSIGTDAKHFKAGYMETIEASTKVITPIIEDAGVITLTPDSGDPGNSPVQITCKDGTTGGINPVTNDTGQCGTASKMWKHVYGETIHGGDIELANKWVITEEWADGSFGPQREKKDKVARGVAIFNEKGEKLFLLDHDGNLHLKGRVIEET